MQHSRKHCHKKLSAFQFSNINRFAVTSHSTTNSSSNSETSTSSASVVVLRHFGVPKFHQLIIRCDHAMMICHWFGESLFTILFNETGTVQGKNKWTYY